MLQQLMMLIQTGSLLEGLMKVTGTDDALALIRQTLIQEG